MLLNKNHLFFPLFLQKIIKKRKTKSFTNDSLRVFDIQTVKKKDTRTKPPRGIVTNRQVQKNNNSKKKRKLKINHPHEWLYVSWLNNIHMYY